MRFKVPISGDKRVIVHKVTGAFRFHTVKASDLNLETNLSAEGQIVYAVMPQTIVRIYRDDVNLLTHVRIHDGDGHSCIDDKGFHVFFSEFESFL